jgi:hypothetical protein
MDLIENEKIADLKHQIDHLKKQFDRMEIFYNMEKAVREHIAKIDKEKSRYDMAELYIKMSYFQEKLEVLERMVLKDAK